VHVVAEHADNLSGQKSLGRRISSASESRVRKINWILLPGI